MIKVTHTSDWKGHTIIIEAESTNSSFDSKAALEISGRGQTKAAAIRSGLLAIEGAAAEINEIREKLSAL